MNENEQFESEPISFNVPEKLLEVSLDETATPAEASIKEEAAKFMAYRQAKVDKFRDQLIALYNSDEYSKISLDEVVLPVLKSDLLIKSVLHKH